MIWIGCCGFQVSRQKYFRTFDVVEVQQTFYKPPSQSTLEKWRVEAPNDFEFIVKAWQLITHPPTSPTYRKAGISVDGKAGYFIPSETVFDAWETTKVIAKVLESKIILFQTPYSFKDHESNIKNMQDFFNSLEREFIFAWEPRGWSPEKIKLVCENLNLIHVTDPFASLPSVDSEIMYFRLHGKPPGKRMYKYTYTNEDFENLRRNIDKFSIKEIYCLFNNITMFQDAQRFREIFFRN
jgi:uncharacterized protein YecE (DUF72 family)